MALTLRYIESAERPKDTGNLYVPEPAHRQFVELLVAMDATQDAICRQLVSLGIPCASPETLRRAFPEELAHGRERREFGYGLRVHAIAMSNTPQALPALRYMLGAIGGPIWRTAKEEDEPLMPTSDGETVHIYMPPNGRDQPDPEDAGPTIEGQAEAA